MTGLKRPAPFGIFPGASFVSVYLSGINVAESVLVILTFPGSGSSFPLGRVSTVP
ncbi:hypothetical protein [Clostridium sp. VAP41]|uniref:hypothetical protein n=1 Tax=Clostridium sp. VAP41 TaxID=2949979 RepID=UPI00207ACAE6|nr:hypothetical protein [Clostridium sp. VAP41]